MKNVVLMMTMTVGGEGNHYIDNEDDVPSRAWR